MFLTEEATISSITVTSTGNSYSPTPDGNGDFKTYTLSADVTADGIGANKQVTWSIDETTVGEQVEATISDTGILTVTRPEKHGAFTGIKVIATSVADPSVTGEWTTA